MKFKILAMLLVATVAFGQSGPRGRAIKADQVLYGTNELDDVVLEIIGQNQLTISNQSITATNFVKVNQNTEATTNLFRAVAQDLLGLDLGGANMTDYMAWVESFQQMDTNYPTAPSGGFSFPNVLNPIYTNIIVLSNATDLSIGTLNTNISATQLAIALNTINTNFTIVAQDFNNLDAYLLGGTAYVYSLAPQVITQDVAGVGYAITNYVVTPSLATVYSPDGSATNAALVPALQYNTDITTTNFSLVNTNTYVTTNLFNIIGQALGFTGTNLSNFTDWIDAYQTMDLGYTTLPTNLVFSFPSVLQPISAEITSVSNSLATYTTYNQLEVYFSDFSTITNQPDNTWIAASNLTSFTYKGATNWVDSVDTNAFRFPYAGMYQITIWGNHSGGGIFGLDEVDGAVVDPQNRNGGVTHWVTQSAVSNITQSSWAMWRNSFTTNSLWTPAIRFGSTSNQLNNFQMTITYDGPEYVGAPEFQ